MAKRKKTQPRRQRRSYWPILIAAGALLLLAGLVAALRSANQISYSPEVTGGPSLRIDQKKIDLGAVQLGTPASVSVKLQNVGDQPLRFDRAPWVEVVEGC